jgi:hypothetical protein
MNRTAFDGVLSRVSSTNNNLRTSSVEGSFWRLPAEGSAFQMYAEALDPGMDFREVTTSKVKEVTRLKDGELTFKTENSTYHLTYKNGTVDDTQ